jgi:hypothetical protein
VRISGTTVESPSREPLMADDLRDALQRALGDAYVIVLRAEE